MKKYSNSLMLTAISACLYIGAINVASAKVCFIVGGCDRDNGQHVGNESCQDLGYTVLASQCTGNTVPYDSCTQGSTTYYKGCRCPDKYKYQEVVGDNYDYINKCTETDSNGSTDKYERKICETGYNYIEKPSSDEQDNLDSVLDIIRDYNLNGTAKYCENNSIPYTYESCVDKFDVPSITRYKTCACLGNYKYRKISTKGFDARVFEGVNMCKGSDNVEHYESAQCKGAQVGNYIYRSECADDEISEPGSNNVNIKRWTAEYGGSFTQCLPCRKKCDNLSEATCKTEIAKAENKGKHCKKTGDNCYVMEAGGLCPLPTCPTGYSDTKPSDGKIYISERVDGNACYKLATCDDVRSLKLTNYTNLDMTSTYDNINATLVKSSSNGSSGYTTLNYRFWARSVRHGPPIYIGKAVYTFKDDSTYTEVSSTDQDEVYMDIAVNGQTCYYAQECTSIGHYASREACLKDKWTCSSYNGCYVGSGGKFTVEVAYSTNCNCIGGPREDNHSPRYDVIGPDSNTTGAVLYGSGWLSYNNVDNMRGAKGYLKGGACIMLGNKVNGRYNSWNERIYLSQKSDNSGYICSTDSAYFQENGVCDNTRSDSEYGMVYKSGEWYIRNSGNNNLISCAPSMFANGYGCGNNVVAGTTTVNPSYVLIDGTKVQLGSSYNFEAGKSHQIFVDCSKSFNGNN